MTVPTNENQVQQDQKIAEKELNFRALEAKFQRELEKERAARAELERVINERNTQTVEDDDSDPYVDHKKLNKRLENFSEKAKEQTQGEIKKAINHALYEERKNNWLKNNQDFYDVMKHAEKFAQHDPELAETILEMPEGFERQKLVYKNIKALGLHRPPEEKKSGIQDKIDANRKSPYYQPTGVGNTPYASSGDFSSSGQKNAYDKMQELKKRLRI